MTRFADQWVDSQYRLRPVDLAEWDRYTVARVKVRILERDLKIVISAMNNPARSALLRQQRDLFGARELLRKTLTNWQTVLVPGELRHVDEYIVSPEAWKAAVKFNVRDWTFSSERAAVILRSECVTVCRQLAEDLPANSRDPMARWANRVSTFLTEEIRMLKEIRGSC
jgi:hypothetical protein